MAEERDPIERLLDLVVFAPLGLAGELRHRLPELAQTGRQQAQQQVQLARFIGKFAVQIGRQQIEKQVREALGRSGAGDDAAPTAASPGDVAAEPVAEVPSPEPDADVSADELPIAGYDTLAASQVVTRLADLDADERELVRRYESANRRRRTILGRLDQLSAREP